MRTSPPPSIPNLTELHHQPPVVPTRDALLAAARTLFAQQGYASVSVRQIAEAAGANVAAINYHFGSKRDLYLETVRLAMSGDEKANPYDELKAEPVDEADARRQLVRFVRQFLNAMVAPEADRSCALLMMWEAVQPSEAIDAVISNFIRPRHDLLVRLVTRLLPPERSGEAIWCARSVLGQILLYHSFRHFVERLPSPADGENPAPVNPEEAGAHIVRFSLRAMGFDESAIDRALQEAAADLPLLPSSSGESAKEDPSPPSPHGA